MKPILASDYFAKPLEERYDSSWPPIEFYVHENQITHNAVDGLEALINKSASETEIDKYLSSNPELLSSVLDINNTGHHGAWVIPKSKIRNKISSEMPGLIPDFLIGGKNSCGISWYVIELKGASHKLFSYSGKKLRLSNVANLGLMQVLEYMHFCNTSQSYLRETMKFSELSYVDGFLFVGRSSETEEQRRKDLKASLNKMNPNLQIRSYDSLVQLCRQFAMINAQKRK